MSVFPDYGNPITRNTEKKGIIMKIENNRALAAVKKNYIQPNVEETLLIGGSTIMAGSNTLNINTTPIDNEGGD